MKDCRPMQATGKAVPQIANREVREYKKAPDVHLFLSLFPDGAGDFLLVDHPVACDFSIIDNDGHR